MAQHQVSQQQNAAPGNFPPDAYAPGLATVPSYGGGGHQEYHNHADPRSQAAYYHRQQAGTLLPNAMTSAAAAPVMHQDLGQAPQQPIQYIATPPPAVHGVFPNPNSSPFTTAPRSASTLSPSSRAVVRFQCKICGQTFSRDHDRKRHHESQHAENPPVYRCEFCHKEFARADSLKRHVDGGCDRNRHR